jgi:hypothetical protein
MPSVSALLVRDHHRSNRDRDRLDRHESNRCGHRCGDRRPSEATSFDTTVGRDSRHRCVARLIANRASRQLHGSTIATRRNELERLRGAHVDVHLLRSFQPHDLSRRNVSGTCTDHQLHDSDDHVLRTHVHPLSWVSEGDWLVAPSGRAALACVTSSFSRASSFRVSVML